MRKCIYCHRGIRDSDKLIALYNVDKTGYIYFFCSWWHVVKWHLLKWIKGLEAEHK
ncbi:unnamed protein product [marine sediment metagenome]|uniref:PARP-type domain-containing protein n=1 Tax=marine sediment metagenome TaxID=412755 RepID=X1K0W1_9ZZZZ